MIFAPALQSALLSCGEAAGEEPDFTFTSISNNKHKGGHIHA
jgi:hypothetical protein